MPTFYAVDIILRPEEERGVTLQEQGSVIEIGGSNGGASFYKIGDYGYYERVMRQIKAEVGDRAVIMEYDPMWEFDKQRSEAMKKGGGQKYEDHVAYMKQWLAFLDNNVYGFDCVTDYSLDRLRWEEERRDEYKTSQKGLYLAAARRVGVNCIATIDTNLCPGLVEYTERVIDPAYLAQFDLSRRRVDEPLAVLQHGEVPPMTFKWGHIPMEMLGFEWLRPGPKRERLLGRERVLNSYFAESVLDKKWGLYEYAKLLDPEHRDLLTFFPPTFLFGLGMHTERMFRQWVEQTPGDLFFRKPPGEAHGIGIEALTRADIQRYVRPAFRSGDVGAIERGYARAVYDLLLGKLGVKEMTAVFQQGARSKLVTDPQTGKKHTACARAIVVNGKYMGAIWRSSKKDDDPKASLTERLRHNVTNGGHVLPVSEEDSRVIGELAEAVVASFERTNERVEARVGELDYSFLGRMQDDDTYGAPAFKVGRALIGHKLKAVATKTGVDVMRGMRNYAREIGAQDGGELLEVITNFERFWKQL